MEKLKKILRFLGNVQWWIGVMCLLLIVVSVSAGVFCRKVLNSPLDWVEELCTFLFIWLAFSGASVAAMNGKNVCADFFTGRLSAEGQNKLFIVQRVIMLILLALMFVSAVCLQPKMTGHSSTSLGITKNMYYFPILFSSLYMFLIYGVELVEHIQKLKIKK